MRIETKVYFAVFSHHLGPEQLTSAIGATPTSIMRRGAKDPNLPRPVTNAWQMDSGLGPHVHTADHLDALAQRIGPLVDAIAALCQGEPSSVLQIVRYFHPATDCASLGLGLYEPWADILRRTGAGFDVDEYDYTVPE